MLVSQSIYVDWFYFFFFFFFFFVVSRYCGNSRYSIQEVLGKLIEFCGSKIELISVFFFFFLTSRLFLQLSIKVLYQFAANLHSFDLYGSSSLFGSSFNLHSLDIYLFNFCLLDLHFFSWLCVYVQIYIYIYIAKVCNPSITL